MKKARKLDEVQAERAAKQAEQAARERARETRQRVKAVATGREAPAVRLPMPQSTITGERHASYRDPVGPDRYTVARFLSDCDEGSKRALMKAWKAGDQLMARRIPVDSLPAVVILASYLKQYEADLVDDFDALLQRYADHITECAHPDKFFASCVMHLRQRFQSPDEEAFESINIPAIYEELF